MLFCCGAVFLAQFRDQSASTLTTRANCSMYGGADPCSRVDIVGNPSASFTPEFNGGSGSGASGAGETGGAGGEDDEDNVPGLKLLNDKIKITKDKMQATRIKLKSAAQMAVKADLYRGMVKAYMNELITMNTLRKKKILQAKLKQQREDMQEVERMNEDIMDKLGNIKSARDAIQETIDYTTSTLMKMSGGGAGGPPKITNKDAIQLVGGIHDAQEEQVGQVRAGHETDLTSLSGVLKEALADKFSDKQLQEIDTALQSDNKGDNGGRGKESDAQIEATKQAEEAVDGMIEKAIADGEKTSDADKNKTKNGSGAKTNEVAGVAGAAEGAEKEQ